MSSTNPIDDTIRARILSDPETILEDPDVMRALIAANDKARGSNIVDLRGVAMQRLEDRLGQLETTHKTVIATAYENHNGMNQIHRAILRMLEAPRFETFLTDLGGDVAAILKLDAVRLVLESREGRDDPALAVLDKILCVAPEGYIETYLTGGRNVPVRDITLRATDQGGVFGRNQITSEACLRLDLGDGRLPGMLVLGSANPDQFTPQQGTDLLAFFSGVFERSLRHWLG